MDKYHIAVLDIGKTNKKLIIFDSDLNITDIEKTHIEEYEKENIRHDDLKKIEDWMIRELKSKSSQYDIKVISVSAHGATFACVDEHGALAVPEVSYTTEPGKDFHNEFYEKFGSREYLQRVTGTPDFNLLINVAKGIWYVKNKYKCQFEQVKHILNLPQYFCYKLTGEVVAEPTYVGCHTYLWDFKRNTWSEVAEKMGVKHLLPEKIKNPWESLGSISKEIADSTGLGPDTIVTAGIHDSNASLLPHLITSEEDFVLNSTGTWCVIMHEEDEAHFNEEELGKVVFFNLSTFSKPVKTSIFMGGVEFEAYDAIFRKLNKSDENNPFDRQLYERIIKEKKLFILPGITRGTGQFPDSAPRIIENGQVYRYEDVRSGKVVPEFFRQPELAYAVLNLSLAIQTKISLERADMRNGIPLYTEGGFSNNESYNILLTSFYPESNIYLTNLNEATAFGAALIGKAAAENRDPRDFGSYLNIEKIPVKKVRFKGLDEYVEKFLDLI